MNGLLEKTTRMNYLVDFYQTLLTPKQQSYMNMYYAEDYSLGEISELFLVSRQAVYDNVKRTEEVLENYEMKLQLYTKFKQRNKLLDQLEITTENETALDLINQLKELD